MKSEPEPPRPLEELEPLKEAARDVDQALQTVMSEADDAVISHYKVTAAIAQAIRHLQDAVTVLERILRLMRIRKGKAP